MLGIIDYNISNLYSVRKALDFINVEYEILQSAKNINRCHGIILPGVGAFGNAVKNLQEKGFWLPLLNYMQENKPLLGICLGMQLLLSESHEFGKHYGFNIIHGQVLPIPEPEKTAGGFKYKTPHIGWNKLLKQEHAEWQDTILENIAENDEFYFVHSFIAVPSDSSHVLANIEYAGLQIPAVISKGNIYGCQFHAEKSRDCGIGILKNFVKLVLGLC